MSAQQMAKGILTCMENLIKEAHKAPWDKLAETSNSLWNMRDPHQDVKMEFTSSFCRLLDSLSKGLDKLMYYLLIPYCENNSSLHSRRSQDDSFHKVVNPNPCPGPTTTHTHPLIKNSEFEYILILRRALFLGDAYSSHMCHTCSLWTDVIQGKEEEVRFTLRGQLFVELWRIRIIIKWFSLNEMVTLRKNGRCFTLGDFQFVKQHKLYPPGLLMNLPLPLVQNKTHHTNKLSQVGIAAMVLRIDGARIPRESAGAGASASASSEKYILDYNMYDLSESIRFLLYKWNTVEYHNHLEIYVNELIYRMCFIAIFGSELEDPPSTRGGGGEEICNVTDFASASTPNFSFLYWAETKYQHLVIEKLHKINHTTKLYSMVGGEAISNDRAMVSVLLSKYCKEWASNKMAVDAVSQKFQQKVLTLLCPPGDEDWMRFRFPLEPLTVNNVFSKLHDASYLDIIEESKTSLLTLLNPPNRVLERRRVRIQDEAALMILDTIFSSGFSQSKSFCEKFVVPPEREHEVLYRKRIRKLPFLSCVFNRYLVCYLKDSPIMKGAGSASSPLPECLTPLQTPPYESESATQDLRIVLKCSIVEVSIFDAVATLLSLLKHYHDNNKNTQWLWDRINELDKNKTI